METIGTLAGGIAHDFNNILATIMGYTDMALKEIPSDSEHYRDFIQVMKASNRGKELVKKILTFSRQMEQRYEPVHFDTVVRESIDLIKPSLEAGVVINADIEQRCDAVMGDPTQLQQVVMNLLTNAAYAMQKTGGTIGIELKCILSGDPEMVYTPQLLGEKYLMLKVSDTGTGMKEEVASRIFEPFFTTKPVGEGTGLGLAVTHGIVKNMDGEIHVESEEGKGSVFRVYFPVQDSERKAGDPAAGKPGSGSERILVVDDEKEFLEMVRKMLEKLGYTVDIQENPLMVPDILQEGSSEYDLIIIDHVMPKFTGMQLAEKIQKLKPGIPMILITGYAETFPAEKIRKMGFREYLYKPVTSKELNNAIRMALRKTAKKRT